jgi:MtrB/PioB family decaheme-associated outer membrane protein
MAARTITTRMRPAGPNCLSIAIALALLAPAAALARNSDQDSTPAGETATEQEPAVADEDLFTLDEPDAEPDAESDGDLTRIYSTLEFGGGYVSEDALRFGRHRGLEAQGAFGVLNIDYLRRGPHDADSADYLHFQGRHLGLDSREAALEFGRQGDYRVYVDYSQIPTWRTSAHTIFNGVGSATLTLPAGWVAAGTTAGMTRLLPSLHGVKLGNERRRVGVGIDKVLHGRWELSAGFRNEDRDGLKTTGAVIGNSGGNPRSVLLPEPIDYQTREFDAAARFNGASMQFELRYYLSLFDNANDGMTWQNPFAAIAGWHPSAGFPSGQGRQGMAPDNRFHQISALAGYNLSERTRISADVAFGQMTQDQAFLPYTVNPALQDSIVQPLPRTSLDGRIDTTVVNLRLASRPSANLHWGASYRYDDRDNRTPRDEYVYIGGDSQTQDAGPTSSRRRFNEPYSFREQRLRFDVGYRLGGQTRLSASAERRQTDRTYSERERAEEDSFTAALHRSFGDRVEATLRLSRAERDGSTYHGNEPFLSGYSSGYIATVPGQWENAPALRKYFLADRRRDVATLRVAVTPSERWSIGLDASRTDEDYRSSELGLTAADVGAYSMDVAFVPSADWTFHGFYTREEFDFDQAGQSIRGGATRLLDAVDPARRWTARHADRVDTAGLGFRWKPRPARYAFGADYLQARSESDIHVTVGAALTAAELPSNITRMDSLSLYGERRLRNDWSMRATYWYERYRSTDWALDGVAANQLANVILMAEESPDYRAHVITLSLLYRF